MRKNGSRALTGLAVSIALAAPDVAQLYEGRDLAVTTDFRDLLAEVLSAHLGARNLGRVFPGHAASPALFPGVMRA